MKPCAVAHPDYRPDCPTCRRSRMEKWAKLWDEPYPPPDLPEGTSPTPVPPTPVSWPRLARLIRQFRRSGDTGVGDTLARWIGAAGGELYKAWYKRITGRECGCSDRQAALNTMYPYANG